MPEFHAAPGHPPIPCMAARFGSCSICGLITPGSPTYSEPHHRMFHPEAFPDPVSPIGEIAKSPEPPWMADAPPRQEHRPPDREQVAVNLKAHKAVKACPHRGGMVNNCACTGRWHCALGKGSVAGQPTLSECLACVAADAPEKQIGLC